MNDVNLRAFMYLTRPPATPPRSARNRHAPSKPAPEFILQVVLFNGMEKTSHWAALYFVLLMTFGNYVLFNLLVAILVEGFSQEVSSFLARQSSSQGESIILLRL